MSTHSMISVKLPDGRVRSIYCHFDGHIRTNGRMLLENYNSQELAEQVTSLGHISYLAQKFEPSPESKHCFSDPEFMVTVVYSRDRGEEDQTPYIWHSEEDFMNDCHREEYNYFFKDGEWYVDTTIDGIPTWTKLSGVFQENELF